MCVGDDKPANECIKSCSGMSFELKILVQNKICKRRRIRQVCEKYSYVSTQTLKTMAITIFAKCDLPRPIIWVKENSSSTKFGIEIFRRILNIIIYSTLITVSITMIDIKRNLYLKLKLIFLNNKQSTTFFRVLHNIELFYTMVLIKRT